MHASPVSPELVANQKNLLTYKLITSLFVLYLPLQILSGKNTGREQVN